MRAAATRRAMRPRRSEPEGRRPVTGSSRWVARAMAREPSRRRAGNRSRVRRPGASVGPRPELDRCTMGMPTSSGDHRPRARRGRRGDAARRDVGGAIPRPPSVRPEAPERPGRTRRSRSRSGSPPTPTPRSPGVSVAPGRSCAGRRRDGWALGSCILARTTGNPFVAADPNAPWVYVMVARYGSPLCDRCPDPVMMLERSTRRRPDLVEGPAGLPVRRHAVAGRPDRRGRARHRLGVRDLDGHLERRLLQVRRPRPHLVRSRLDEGQGALERQACPGR